MSGHGTKIRITAKEPSAMSSSQEREKSVDQSQATRPRPEQEDLPKTSEQSVQPLSQLQEQNAFPDKTQTTQILAAAKTGPKKKNSATYEDKQKIASAVDEMNEAQMNYLVQLIIDNSESELGHDIELEFDGPPKMVQNVLLLYIRGGLGKSGHGNRSKLGPFQGTAVTADLTGPRVPVKQKRPKPSEKTDLLDKDYQPNNRHPIQTDNTKTRTARTRGATEKDTPEARANVLFASLDKEKGSAHDQVLRSLITSVQKMEQDVLSVKAEVVQSRELIEKVDEKYFDRKYRIRPHDRLTVDYLRELLTTAVSKKRPYNDFFDTLITALEHLRNGMMEKSGPAPRGDQNDQQLPSDSEGVKATKESPHNNELEAELDLAQRGTYNGGRGGHTVYSTFPLENKDPIGGR